MKVIKTYLLFGTLFLLGSCVSDNEYKDRYFCIQKTDGLNNGCEYLTSSGSDRYCGVEYLGSYELKDQTLDYMRPMCFEEEEVIQYQNSQTGTFMNFRVKEHYFRAAQESVASTIICSNDTTKRKGYCYETEELGMRMISRYPYIDLTFSLSTVPDMKDLQLDNFADVFKIERKQRENVEVVEMYEITAERGSSLRSTAKTEMINTMNFGGIVYYNVLSNVTSHLTPDQFKYYYTQQEGLVAFRDLDNVLWHRVY